MAKLCNTKSASHPDLWALQPAEDVLVGAAYLDLEDAFPKNYRNEFVFAELTRYWLNGGGLSDRTLVSLNNIRLTAGLPPIIFVDGHSTTYSLMRGEPKALHRRDILERLRAQKLHNPEKYNAIVANADRNARALPSRDPLLRFVA